MKDGRESPGALSDADKRTIERNIREDVLDATRHPQIRFQSKVVERRGDEATIRGTLQLHGQEREVVVRARREGGAVVAEARLHQPDFGIKPYSAMMGTLRVKPDIEVRLRAQVPA
jgi:polyisoprenoid-binding protein YceI